MKEYNLLRNNAMGVLNFEKEIGMETTKQAGNLVFLAGTTDRNTWRGGLIARLVQSGISRETLFNPVVEHWTEEARKREREAKAIATHLFVYIGDPKSENGLQLLSPLSLFEATMGLYDKPDTTVLVLDRAGLQGRALKLVDEVAIILKQRFPTGNIFRTLEEGEEWLRKKLLMGSLEACGTEESFQ